MDPQDIRSLQFLEEIDNDHSPTQRALARKFNISLGLVNSFIKRLARKGYVKVATIPRKRVKYILTPKGFAEKSRLTYEFIQYSLHFYKKALREFQDLVSEFETMGVKKVVFYGATDLAEIASISLRVSDIELIDVVDDLRVGEDFLGYVIKPITELSKLEFDRIIVTTIDSRESIFDKLLQKKIPRDKIILLE
jgi:DNA-binding MarR family transcriptional regulator